MWVISGNKAVRTTEKVSIDVTQFGLMPRKGTTDTIFTARTLQGSFLVKKKALSWAFVDLKKVFKVVWSLRKLRVEGWLAKGIMG